MRNIHILSYTTYILLSSVICSSAFAEENSNTVNTGKSLICRQIIENGVKNEQVYCGTEEQWAELDRRAKLINAGITCRWDRTPRELCMNSKQWKEYDRRLSIARSNGGQIGMSEASASAAIQSRIYNDRANPYGELDFKR